jgi:hypothetical protein
MSLVKIQGNASGTGTLTIAAPNTNSDRTLTLPDQTGTLLTGSGAISVNASAPVPSVAVDASGNVGIGTTSPGGKLEVNQGKLIIKTTDQSLSRLQIANTGASGQTFEIVAGDVGTSNTGLSFYDVTNSATRMRIDASGNLQIGGSGNPARLNVVHASTYGVFIAGAAGSSTPVIFFSGATNTGSISTNGTTTSFNTSSDYRLKENIAPMTGALAKVQALKPCTYTWKATGETDEGFVAHELQEVCPSAVSGVKDAINEDGSIKPQGIDTSFLVATLTAAIQELKAIVDAQGAEIAALKGQA